ncbi:exonuclease mut-7 homolog isoform X1 [Struthio camelus]|uniref:exonuclease mut-7 homolog isoform X1 n=2 Tax=Struthio camelus TaxID=8801 RepID=UPI00051E3E42|nr:PREDICTED: exonuclease mut-7 homolog isoform X1 [Struthio camelus australis]XP_009666373.1 PREDICTED: exonuclease mut-7 homolog isoform X1 [Struthio camelus australis]XP_009666374.1 PREDICTED: exonuclease mut-7 homolog isoform X1 [Struthio camelus australis]XP_009666375.1 PREDICTED: exonuclease mut-7 homolog isoform X1 [Struthio camelus australis]
MNQESNSSDQPGGQDPLLLLKTLQLLWTKKEMKQLKEEIRRGFAGLEDPLAGLLDMLENNSDWKGKGHSLGYYITSELQLWIKEHPAVQQSGMKLKKLQARVFRILAQCPANLLDPLISIYQLHTADRNYLLGHVSHLYHKGDYKEAAILSIKLKLQPDQDVEKMCTPLLLQDKTNLVEAYVGEYPELQCKLLQILDTWCEPSFNIKDISRQYQGLSKYKPDKFNHKMLSKLVFRLLERFNVDPALCPNVINQRHLRTLNYLFYKRFVEKSMTQENWTDHVQNTVGENRWLQGHLIQLLISYSDMTTAARWAQRCNLPKEMLPYGVADELQRLKIQERVEEAEKAENYEEGKKKDYYQPPIPRANIHFLQTWEEMLQCWEKVLRPGQVVGIDMEWRPSFGVVGKPRVSLLQIAVGEEVFLLDLPQLLEQAEREDEKEKLSHFIQRLYLDPAITKLGYGMSGDLNSLAATCSALKDMDKQSQGVVDLLTVDKQLQKSSIDWKKSGRKVNVLSPEPSCEDRAFRQPERGLSLLVQHVLGKPLDKTEQLSNWEKRPLREEQILYAASDAYCLLEVYEKLCKDPASFGLSSNLTESLMGKPSIKPRAKKQLNKQEVSSSSGQQCKGFDEEASCSPDPISPKEFSVVCDNMLQGLGRYLRCLGVDVRILENEDDHRKAAEIARQEGRVILTSGLPYQTLQSQVGEGRCFSVNCSEKAKEQALQVLKHFNVQVTLADIFSRCQVCNCNKYLKISKERMRQLMEDSRHSTAEDDASHLTRAEEKPSQTCDAATPAHDSPQPIYNPNCQCLEDSDLTGESVMLANGTVLQVSAIPPGVLDKAELTYFYCCTCCGKVFWEGSHFGRVVSQFKDILSAMEDDHSFYDLS